MRFNLTAELMLLLCTVIWGGTFLAVKFALPYCSPWLLVALRFGVAAALFGLIFWRQLAAANLLVVRRGFALGLALCIGFGLQTLGLQYTSVSRSAYLTYALIIFTPFLSLVLLGKRPAWTTLAGILVVVAGLYLLTAPGDAPGWNRGDWLTLGCALAFSFYIVGVDRWSAPETQGALAAVQSASVGLLAAPLALLENANFEASPALLLSIFYLAVPGALIVVYLQMRYQPLSTPARASVIFAMEPVFTLLYAAALGLERPGSRELLGAVTVFCGVLLSEAAAFRRTLHSVDVRDR
ncbi:MAG: DMT family transporter [Leptospirales bacterium]|nr:DMT family transporter [Leptospirales bacterium]